MSDVREATFTEGAVCPRCKDWQPTKGRERDGLTVFCAHAAKGTSPRIWCRESGQPVDSVEVERVRLAVESLANGPQRPGANDGVATDAPVPTPQPVPTDDLCGHDYGNGDFCDQPRRAVRHTDSQAGPAAHHFIPRYPAQPAPTVSQGGACAGCVQLRADFNAATTRLHGELAAARAERDALAVKLGEAVGLLKRGRMHAASCPCVLCVENQRFVRRINNAGTAAKGTPTPDDRCKRPGCDFTRRVHPFRIRNETRKHEFVEVADQRLPGSGDAMFCAHANEVPARCPCRVSWCYCKTRTCAGTAGPGEGR